MHTRLSLRLRIFLFFCLLALGGIAVTTGALWLGYSRSGHPELTDAFLFSGLLSGFAMLGLCAGIWLLFDENVAKPIERLAAGMRARAHAGVNKELDTHGARYLGDLAAAAQGLAGQLGASALSAAEAIARETEHLEAEKARLAALLTDIPIATVMASPAHQIVLYDGQAAAVLAEEAPPRLNAPLSDYLDLTGLEAAYGRLIRTGMEVQAEVKSASGAQVYDLRLKPLGGAPGYIILFEGSHAGLAPGDARPLVYDFALLHAEHAELENRNLAGHSYVVFDTETTGLLPHKDEIVQIGALRVVRGRIIESETFETLVDPGCPIPAASTKVHGVSDAMVQGAPQITEAARHFHRFASDAVIVAHNAPFDMAFLHRHAKRTGVIWDQPVLDTVLLSAVLFGASQSHTLDALCERLDVTIPPALRHTAMGDARATAEVFCKMLPMLEARGIGTFGAVLQETRKHSRLIEDMN
ncbi:3'-5' exonuclease [Leisingera aquaemixtae]|uniref:3'-5' exonuclease n=1 Tax=Leisingera TaxID=191028 RepID=UPI001C95CF80|nr:MULTISPECIES: 3'-5' exonuclease [Leisingera]MBY6065898.1 3'-5' exonuclease [Leisingera aquaemixtae]MCB4455492.1 3'-5' exonuclease [Leisingera sp. McT4-56]